MTPLEERIVAAVARNVVSHLEGRSPGHCVQIANLSREVADAACELAYQQILGTNSFVRLVVEGQPSKPWHATPRHLRANARQREQQHHGRLMARATTAIHDRGSRSRSSQPLPEMQDRVDTVRLAARWPSPNNSVTSKRRRTVLPACSAYSDSSPSQRRSPKQIADCISSGTWRRSLLGGAVQLDSERKPERVGDPLERGDGRTDTSSFETSDCRLAGAHPFGELALRQ